MLHHPTARSERKVPSVPRLSIVIPAVGAIEALESTLVAVLENRPRDCEILVVLNQPYSDPYSLQGEVQFIPVDAQLPWAECVNLGASHCRSPIIHVLGADCEVGEGWSDSALANFQNRQVAAVAPVVYSTLDRERLIAAGVGYSAGGRRSFAKLPAMKADKGPVPILGPVGFAAFYRREVFQAIGGFNPQLGEMADVDVALTLRAAGLSAILDGNSRTFAGPRIIAASHGYAAGLHNERLFWRNAPAAGWVKSLVCHPATVGIGAIRELPRISALTGLVGRIVACCQWGLYPARHAQLRRLEQESRETITLPTAQHHLRIDTAHDRDKSGARREARAKAG